MADVAKAVGVSRQLVGLAFRNEPGVSKATAGKIKSAAKKLGYSPNLAAQSLRREGSRYIGVVFHTSHSSSEELIPNIYREAEKLGFKLVLSAISKDRNDQLAIAEVIGHRCDGLILISSHLPDSEIKFLAEEMPVVSISRRISKIKCGSVTSAGETGIEKTVDYLVKLGHKKIAYINTSEMLDSEFRLSGYKTAMNKHKLKEDICNISGDYVEAAGARAAEQLLMLNKLPTAIICSNDQVALGLIHTFLKSGIRVPSDISVTGYDDTIAKLPFLDLTTIHQDPNELAKAAVNDLALRIENPNHPATTHLTSAELIVRTSTDKPKSK